MNWFLLLQQEVVHTERKEGNSVELVYLTQKVEQAQLGETHYLLNSLKLTELGSSS